MAAGAKARVSTATDLLEALGDLSDPQVALRPLLRPCGGHARLVHLMRCVPPLAQQATLLDFDVRVRHCLAAMCNGSKLPGTLATAVWHFALLCPTPPLPTSLLLATWTRCLTAVPCCPHQQPPGPSLLNSHLDAPLTIEAAAAKQRRCLTKLVDSAILGFAVTGPQRTESLSQATNKPVSAAAAYADPKATHQDTGRLCSEQGVHFQPMVAETTGAWDKTASHVLHIVAAAVAAREGAAVADLYSRLLQELSITTRRFRAQAALRRRAEIINQTQPIARASAALLEGWAEHLDESTESRDVAILFLWPRQAMFSPRLCSVHFAGSCF